MYYKFVPVADPTMTMNWQRELCQRLNLKGRIIISKHGINGTLGGDIEDLKRYKREMNKSGIFRGIVYKWSNAGDTPFPRLSVKVRSELVAFRAEDEIEVDEKGIVGGGKHLKPAQLHELIKERGDEVVFFDGHTRLYLLIYQKTGGSSDRQKCTMIRPKNRRRHTSHRILRFRRPFGKPL